MKVIVTGATGMVGELLYPLARLFFPAMPLRDVGCAMIHAVRFGAPKQVLEVADMKALATK